MTNQPTTDTNKPITCKTCGKQDMTDWDGRGNCITCARDAVLSTDTIDERIDKLFPTWFKKESVTFSGEYPTREGTEAMIYQIPYPMFRELVKTAIADFAEHITPEKRKVWNEGSSYPLEVIDSLRDTDTESKGFNACVDTITKRTKEYLNE